MQDRYAKYRKGAMMNWKLAVINLQGEDLNTENKAIISMKSMNLHNLIFFKMLSSN